MSFKHRVLESIKWLVLAQILTQIVRVVVTTFVIRQVSSSDMALVALAQTTTGFLEMFAVLGLNSAIISKKQITNNDIKLINGLIWAINSTIALVLFSLAGPLASFYNEPRLDDVLRVISLSFLISGFGTVAGALLTKEMRFRELSIIQATAGIAGAFASYISVTNGLTYWAIIIGGLTSIGVRSALCIAVQGGYYFPRFSLSQSKEHLTFGGRVMTSNIAWYLYVSMDVVIAGKFWSAEMVGVYAVAVQFTVMPLNRFMPLLKSVALPAFSKTFASDKNKIENYLAKSVRIVLTITLPFFFGIAAVSLDLIPLVLGSKWTQVSLPLALLCLSAPFRSFLELHTPAVVATSNTAALLKNNVTLMIVMLTSFFSVISLDDSPVALALVWTTIFPVMAVYSSRELCKAMNISFKKVIQPILVPFFSSIAMAIVVFAYTRYFSAQMQDGLLLVSAISLGIVTYIGLIFIFDRGLAFELKQLVLRTKP